MTAAAGRWAETVTTALLGTDRREPEDPDPPAALLRAAARHRVVARLRLPVVVAEATAPAPTQVVPEAPVRADRLLDALLRTPDPVLVSCWLAACRDHGRVVAAVRWTALARLAARSTAYDRSALGAALGPRGRWFLRQNPEWRRLAADADAEPPARTEEHPGPGGVPLTAGEVMADPERLLAAPQPWPPDLVSAAYAVLGGAGPTPPARSFATRLGVALPTALYASIAGAGELYVLAPDASPARRRAARDRFVALEYAAYAHAAIHHGFTETTSTFTRAEIPLV